MSRFRKRPVEVDAFLWTGDIEQAEDPVWICEAIADGNVYFESEGSSHIQMAIKTLEGTMLANLGDWIIRGTKGEIYPCKPEIFAEIYEPVEEGNVDDR